MKNTRNYQPAANIATVSKSTDEFNVMKKMIFLMIIGTLLPGIIDGQSDFNLIRGQVSETMADGTESPVYGANVYWLGTNLGTSTDDDGLFEIDRVDNTKRLVISFVGYTNDTIDVTDQSFIQVNLTTNVSLDEIQIVHRKKSTEISFSDPLKIEKIGEKELLKAACCNLSESFETSPSIDVSFSDAVTGTRQIQMLGLAGPNVQITRENMPNVRGMSSLYGMSYIPGTWIESIQLNKGTGSVVNGFESIAGQINVELRKPETAEKLYLNFYANEGGKLEANSNFAHVLKGGKWSTALLLHGKSNQTRNDRNNDGFLDMPLSSNFIGLNRWKYVGDDGLRVQFGIKGTFAQTTGGELDFEHIPDVQQPIWGMFMDVNRYEGWAKIGRVFEDTPWKTYGLQISAVSHNQDSNFGDRIYNGNQKSVYANFVYQSILTNTNHSFKAGASLQYDDYKERLEDSFFDRREVVPGAYFEYTNLAYEGLSFVAGIRGDHHNTYGFFVTPRLHLRYAPNDDTVIRASAGRGQRTANILSENNGLLASARRFEILGDGSDKPYGLNPEVAWNFGINLTQTFRLDYRDGTFSFDFYRTDFSNQIVVDLDQSPRQVAFYNLDGKSFSNSLQAQLEYEIINFLTAKIAYRWFDVKTTFDGELLKKPLVANHRAFLNLAYETRNDWKFDYTVNWTGQKRIPNTLGNPEALRLPEQSPDFVMMNAQVSKLWNERIEVYLGVENILSFRQDSPILASDQPFSEYFDSSLIWGPIFGRNTYVGLRYRLQ